MKNELVKPCQCGPPQSNVSPQMTTMTTTTTTRSTRRKPTKFSTVFWTVFLMLLSFVSRSSHPCTTIHCGGLDFPVVAAFWIGSPTALSTTRRAYSGQPNDLRQRQRVSSTRGSPTSSSSSCRLLLSPKDDTPDTKQVDANHSTSSTVSIRYCAYSGTKPSRTVGIALG